MANGSSTTASGGLGFAGALTILFIALKLLGFIDWSWWWVLAPLWVSAALSVAVLFVVVAVAIVVAVVRRR